MEGVHVAALIEDFRGQFKVFGEALQAQREVLQANNAKLDRLDAKVDGIAADVAVLKVDVAVLKVDVAELKVDMANVKDRLTHVERGVNGKARRRAAEEHVDRLAAVDPRIRSGAHDALRSRTRKR